MIKLIQSLSFILLVLHSSAQNSSDILKFSLARTNGTARFEGAGSSFGAVGADQSCIGINPAGLGLFRKSEFSFGLYNVTLTGNYRVENSSREFSVQNNSTGISNLGLVITRSKGSYSKWTTINYYLGYNNASNFEQKLDFEGRSKGSILHRFLENSIDSRYSDGRGVHPDDLDDFESGLAYETGALYDISNDSNKIVYTNDLLEFRDSLIPKKGGYESEGFLGNFSLGVAANYNEKLILGGSLEIPLGYFENTKNYEEYDPQANFRPFRELKFTDYTHSELSGIKLVLGAIFKPVNQFRIGLSWHSPMWLSSNDSYNTTLSYAYNDKDGSYKSFSAASPDGIYQYKIIIPARWIGSIAFVSKYGFINADIDYFNPGHARFKFDELSELEYEEFLNTDIDKQYKSVLQTRIGIEIPLRKFRIRGGFAFLNSAYENDSSINNSISAGLGYRGKSVFIDLSARFNNYQEAYVPFITGNSDFDNNRTPDAVQTLVQSNMNLNQFMLTIGFKI